MNDTWLPNSSGSCLVSLPLISNAREDLCNNIGWKTNSETSFALSNLGSANARPSAPNGKQLVLKLLLPISKCKANVDQYFHRCIWRQELITRLYLTGYWLSLKSVSLGALRAVPLARGRDHDPHTLEVEPLQHAVRPVTADHLGDLNRKWEIRQLGNIS